MAGSDGVWLVVVELGLRTRSLKHRLMNKVLENVYIEIFKTEYKSSTGECDGDSKAPNY